jgi:hypothetical protein
LRGLLREINDNYTLNKVIGNIPVLNFCSDMSTCVECGTGLIVEKVKQRVLYTVAYGRVDARETIKMCPACQAKYRSGELPQIVKSGSNYAYDCMVEAGSLRYEEKRQIVEIQEIFQNKYHLPVSATQVRRMTYSYLDYLGRMHYSNAEKIKATLCSQSGGYILHVDSTCEGHAPHLLTCLDGISGFVLYSQKIQSENTTSLQTSFEKVKKLFGTPLCSVHDMGRGIINALDLVFVAVIHVICHFHLLRDIGKDLLQDLYRKVQKALSNKQIYAEIRYQTQALEKVAGGKQLAEKLFYQVAGQDKLTSKEFLLGTLYGYLLNLKSHENKGEGYGFPFDRPKLQYYKQICSIYSELLQIDDLPDFDAEIKKTTRFYKVKEALRMIVEDRELKRTIKELDTQIVYFDQLRDIMRITLPESKNGLNDEGKISSEKELKSMEKELSDYIETLKAKIEKEPKGKEKLQGVIKQLEKYWDKIFASPITVMADGNEKAIFPHRTNNQSEQFYRKLKHLFRRLHGRPSVSKDINYLPEEIALIENLKNQDYIKTVMTSLDNLAFEFAKLDILKIELPFEKDDLNLKVSQKLMRTLKNFVPLKTITRIA